MQLSTNQDRSVIEILSASIDLYKKCFLKLIAYSVITVILPFLIVALAAIIYEDLSIYDYDSGRLIASLADKLPAVGIIIFTFLWMLGEMTLNIAVICRIDNFTNQRQDSFTEVLSIAVKKAPSMLVAFFLYVVVVTVGMVLLIIPGIFLSLSLYFFSYFIALENQSAFSSIKASYRLVAGSWWRTALVYLLPVIVITGVSILLAYIDKSNSLSMLLSIFTMPYMMVLGYVQFKELELRKSL